MKTLLKEIDKIEAGQVFVSDTPGLEAIQIMAVVEVFVMARHKLAHPFVYTTRLLKDTFFDYYLLENSNRSCMKKPSDEKLNSTDDFSSVK